MMIPRSRPIHSNRRHRAAIVTAALLFASVATYAQKPEELEILGRDPAGHGVVCRFQEKTILIVSGTPEQMGTAQGTLLSGPCRQLTNRILYGVGGGYSVRTGKWFLDHMAEVERRTRPFLPKRFVREMDALSAAAGMPSRDGRYGNLFPEMFHCSGVAVRGSATTDGSVIHARVLDYMRDVGLQKQATVTVYVPDGFNAWMSLGYAGFIGTVTAMNEKGLAVGEMGGGG